MTNPRLRVIGRVRSRHTALEHTPVQAALNPDEEGSIELDPRYVEALDGLVEFSHLWLLTWLGPLDGEAPEPELRVVPFLLRRNPREMGLLATRGPRRPNPIGLSLVRLLRIDGATIRFAGVDVVDGTPVLDIKPYVSRLDQPADHVRSGWFDTVIFDGAITPASLQPPPE